VGEDPAALRKQIEDTRDRMTEVTTTLAGKVSPTAPQERVSARVDAPDSGRQPDENGSAGGADLPDAGRRQAARALRLGSDNPLAVVAAVSAAGFVAGMLVPSSSLEDERIGPIADQVKDQAREIGQEAADRAQEIGAAAAEQAAEAGTDLSHTLRDEVERQGRELGSTIPERSHGPGE
jgi:hypothetical protein